MQNCKISLAICTCDRHSSLRDTLNSLIKIEYPTQDYEIIIVDNSDKVDEKEKFLIEKLINKFSNIFYFHQPKSKSLSENRNICIEKSKYNYIHFIDDDVYVDKNLLKSISRILNSNSNVGCIGGKINASWSLIQKPNWITKDLLGYLSVLDHGPQDEIINNKPHIWIAGANIGFSKELLIQEGGFSTSLGRQKGSPALQGGEETDMVFKISKKSNVFYSGSVIVDHIISPERLNESWFIKRVAWQSVSDIILNNDISLWLSNSESWDKEQNGSSYIFLKNNIHKIFDTNVPLEKKLKIIHLFSFWILYNFKK